MTDRIVMNKTGTHYYLDGREVTEAEYRRVYPEPPDESLGNFVQGDAGAGWPILSDALAVHADQVPEAIEDAKAKGVPTEFRRDGRMVIRDRGHGNAYLKAYRLHHRNSYTGGY